MRITCTVMENYLVAADPTIPVTELLSLIEQALGGLSPEARDAAEFHLDISAGDGYVESITWAIRYDREETEAERAFREAAERRQAVDYEQRIRERELRQLAILRAKYPEAGK